MNTNKHIYPLSINGLHGRVMRAPALRKKLADEDILLVYGSHASIERNAGMVEALREYGNVTLPDLPGFGGMDHLQKIGKAPSIDNLADYLADFIRAEYSGNRIKIAGFSLGMLVVTRMLQRHPGITPTVSLLASLAGTTHSTDFLYSRMQIRLFRFGLIFLSHHPTSWMIKKTLFSSFVLRRVYAKSFNAKHKFKGLDQRQHDERLNAEIDLWHINEFRTWAHTLRDMLGSKAADMGRVDLNVENVALTGDNYFNPGTVSRNLDKVYNNVTTYNVELESHSPSITANKDEVAAIIPQALAAKLMLQSDA